MAFLANICKKRLSSIDQMKGKVSKSAGMEW